MPRSHSPATDWLVEWRTPLRQRWTSLAGSAVGAGLIAGLTGPLLFLLTMVLLEDQGWVPSRVEPRTTFLGCAAASLLVFLVALALITRKLFHRMTMVPRWLILQGPLRTLRVPLADLQAVGCSDLDGAGDGSVSLGVRRLALVLKHRGELSIWLEPDEALDIQAALTDGEPSDLVPDDSGRGAGAVSRGLARFGLGPVDALKGNVAQLVLGLIAGAALRDAIDGALLSAFSAVVLLACGAFLLRVRWASARRGLARVHVAIDALSFVTGAVVGFLSRF